MEEVRDEWTRSWQDADVEQDIRNIVFEKSITQVIKGNLSVDELVLEAGCGFGRYCFWLEKMNVRAVGVDVARNAVRRGFNYARKRNISARFVICDITHLPFRDNIFDGYISLGVIEHFRMKKGIFSTFQEAFRVLKNEGFAFFTVPSIFEVLRWQIIKLLMPKLWIYHAYISKNELVKVSKAVGFEIKQTKAHDEWASLYYLLLDVLGKWGKEHWRLKSVIMNSLSPLSKVSMVSNVFGSMLLSAKKPSEGDYHHGNLITTST
jgi:ubiquinone/menaquinone biosynthesis C-methylase UbiE